MNNPVADKPERDRALIPERSFIVQAPAGSGKTGLLIQRYLKLLSLVNAPEEIIAITFTRKAAAEMQGRVLAALESAAAGTQPATDNALTTYRLAAAALKRDREKAWNILDNPARLRIQTIDALCAVLTRQMPLLANLGAQPETLETAAALYQQAAINTLAELESGAGWSDAIANLVYYLDNDLPRIKKLIVYMLGQRDQWLAYVTQRHDRNDMERSLTDLIEAQLAVVHELFPAEHRDELITLLRYAAGNLSDPNNPVIHCADISALPKSSAAELLYWKGIANLLLTARFQWRKRLNTGDGFPPAKDKQSEPAECRRRKQQVLALITELQKVEGLQQALATVSRLPPAAYTDAEWQRVQALCDLLKLAAAQLHLIFAERNQMDFIGIAESAITALGEDEAPTDLAMTLDYHIKHLLVDEYQDLSAGQYRLLQRLTRAWSMDDGRSLFLVGDPMQSIYRFREADVGLFIKTFHARRLDNIPLERLKLKVNFRSQQAVVDWINDSFSAILPGHDDMTTGAVSFSAAEAHDKTTTPDKVVIHPVYGKAHQQEAHQTIELVRRIKQENKHATVALLVRSRSHLNDIVPGLRTAGIDFTAVDIEGLATQSCIQDLLALTRAYLYQADKIAWLSCLRAPWCGLKIGSLYQLCAQTQDKTLWQCINDKDLTTQLEPDERKRLSVFTAVFASILNNQQRHPIRRTIESLWCRLGGPATLGHATELENCAAFFCLLESLDRGGTIDDIQELTEQVGRLYAAPAGKPGSTVQIMTIHKAKGLEFDHVILPGLGRSPRTDQRDLLVWLLHYGTQEQGLILAPIPETGGRQSPLYDYINDVDKEKQTFEDGRLLYVAVTRAKKSLHLIGHAGLKENKDGIRCEPQRRSLLALLWPQVKHIYEQNLSPQKNAQPDTDTAPDQATYRLADDWSMPTPPASMIATENPEQELETPSGLIEFEWAGETIRQVGSVVHAAIQLIAEEGLSKWTPDYIGSQRSRFERLLIQFGVPADALPGALDYVTQALNKTLNDERGKWILSDEHRQTKNEYPVSGLYQGKLINVILDRTFIDRDGVRWIIDYKVSRHEAPDTEQFLDQQRERYQGQLEKYGALLQQFNQQKIKLGLYFPLLQGWREWSYN